ncbi:MAG TPA: hypothetical protein VKZ50_14345 [bacterium]|nr:hypothetical protein [bacterium]
MRRILGMIGMGLAATMTVAPMAATARPATLEDAPSKSVTYVAPMDNAIDLVPADGLAPNSLDRNAQGDGSGR